MAAARSLVRAVGAAQPRTVRPSIARAKPARARPTTTRAVPPLGVNLVVAELAESGLEKYSFLGLSVVIIGSVVRRWMGTVMRIRRATWFARCRRKVHLPCHRPEDTAGRCRIR